MDLRFLFLILFFLSWKPQIQAFPPECKNYKLANPISPSGVYVVQPFVNSFVMKQVYCDMVTDDGGWTVIQRRGFYPTQENFYRTFIEYAIGFGNVYRDHYAGNDMIHSLTFQGSHQLRIDLWDFEGNHRYAKYNLFHVAAYNYNYQIRLSGYSGNAGDALAAHNLQPFSARDDDNDSWAGNCAIQFKGAWWYKNCHVSNLNGLYLAGYHPSYANGINWRTWRGYYYSYKAVRMMIRKI